MIDAVDAVNLMTVHAAKGLEFPVVFLVNLGKGAGGTRTPIRLVTEDAHGEPFVAVGDFESDADVEFADREEEETKRLLYVAITRARDRLYLSAVVPAVPWKPARGSLGDVIPRSLADTIGSAASSQATRPPGLVRAERTDCGSAAGWKARPRGHARCAAAGRSDRGRRLRPHHRSRRRCSGSGDGERRTRSAVRRHEAMSCPTRLASRARSSIACWSTSMPRGGDDEERLRERLHALTRSTERGDVTVAEAAVQHAAAIFRGLLGRPAFHQLFAVGHRITKCRFR